MTMKYMVTTPPAAIINKNHLGPLTLSLEYLAHACATGSTAIMPMPAAHNYIPPPTQMVNFAPLGGQIPNVNPSLNQPVPNVPNVHVLNVLDVPPQAPHMLEQFAAADTGYLEGLPGQMFNWGVFP